MSFLPYQETAHLEALFEGFSTVKLMVAKSIKRISSLQGAVIARATILHQSRDVVMGVSVLTDILPDRMMDAAIAKVPPPNSINPCLLWR